MIAPGVPLVGTKGAPATAGVPRNPSLNRLAEDPRPIVTDRSLAAPGGQGSAGRPPPVPQPKPEEALPHA